MWRRGSTKIYAPPPPDVRYPNLHHAEVRQTGVKPPRWRGRGVAHVRLRQDGTELHNGRTLVWQRRVDVAPAELLGASRITAAR